MCVVSMIGDHYLEKWQPRDPSPNAPPVWLFPGWPHVTREEFEALRKEVQEMAALMRRAKDYDERTGQKDCENDAKMAILRKVAELVGVELAL